jgi:hypothetical protein
MVGCHSFEPAGVHGTLRRRWVVGALDRAAAFVRFTRERQEGSRDDSLVFA